MSSCHPASAHLFQSVTRPAGWPVDLHYELALGATGVRVIVAIISSIPVPTTSVFPRYSFPLSRKIARWEFTNVRGSRRPGTSLIQAYSVVFLQKRDCESPKFVAEHEDSTVNLVHQEKSHQLTEAMRSRDRLAVLPPTAHHYPRASKDIREHPTGRPSSAKTRNC